MGLPVYNGESYVGTQVESLLAQTFTDWELVIVDNASTDGTGDICRAFAARDRRVHYHRNDTNIGGGPNVNRAFELASRIDAPYFKWAAHDDIHGPRFLEICVDALDRDPTAVLAFTKAERIDPDGNTIGPRVLTLPLSSPDPLVRFEAILPSYDCLEIYSVIRKQALSFRPVVGLYSDGDGVLLTRLVLSGRFLELPEVQFFNRRHPVQAGTRFKGNAVQWATWWDPKNAQRRVFPTWRRQAELWRAVVKAPMAPRDRLRCVVALARWTRWRRNRLYEDVAVHVKDILGSLRGRGAGPSGQQDGDQGSEQDGQNASTQASG
jgi:glycosyltransferase involved in cell wall biosynthesis